MTDERGIAITARDELFAGLFSTAIEGGITYWCNVHVYEVWENPEAPWPELRTNYTGFRAVVTETEDDEPRTLTIDRRVVSRGYRLATTTFRDKIHWSSETPPLVITDDTDWDYDAGDADAIVQLGLFGEVVYG